MNISGLFDKDWAEEIAEVTASPEFQTATIEIQYVSNDGEYDVDTGETTGRVVETLYAGRARVIAVRTSVFRQAAAMMNSHVSEFVRVQIPRDAVGRVLTGSLVRILTAPEAPFLEGRMLMVNSDFHGASAATRTLECGFDNDQEAS